MRLVYYWYPKPEHQRNVISILKTYSSEDYEVIEIKTEEDFIGLRARLSLPPIENSQLVILDRDGRLEGVWDL